jgi:hypothetical protein
MFPVTDNLKKSGGTEMMNKISINARSCCSTEKQRLVSELRACDYCSDNYKDHHDCYRRVAKESVRNAVGCMIA